MTKLNDTITFSVEGRGPFPSDMLRHSMAWPEGSDDAAKLAGCERRVVVLTAHKSRYVAPARWESFGWRVHNAETFPFGDHVQPSNPNFATRADELRDHADDLRGDY